MKSQAHSAGELRARARAFAGAGNFEMAARLYARAHQLAPNDADILYDLASTAHTLRDYDGAQRYYRRSIELNPALAGAHNDLGILLRDMGEFGKALDLFRTAAQCDPQNAVAASNLGGAFLERGSMDEARASYDRAVTLDPRNGGYLYQLAEITDFTATDTRLATLVNLLREESIVLAPHNRVGLHFALGKALTDIAEYPAAFHHYRTGNALKRSLIAYDEAAALHGISDMAESFSTSLFDQLRRSGDASAAPVFIVGMLRSGSTLVKQILSTHPAVVGIGEVSDFADAVGVAAGRMPSQPQNAAQFLDGLTREHARQITGGYLARLQRRAPGAVRVVDKALTNFRFLGLIAALFPNATILHVMRDPRDTCWSCYSKLFAEPQPFTYDLGELGRYYAAYEKVMARWRAVLPPGAIIDIQYEDLIRDFEPTCRKLIALCGLPWDDKCLAFHRGDSLVRTSSAAQVRKGLFRDGIARSAPFHAHLAPLMHALSQR